MKDQPNKNSSSDFIKSDGGKTKSNSIEVPSITLPKGGGAIKGIDEKFSVNAVNGTSSYTIPLPFSAARGASPNLTISYNSGSGNSPFGLGWNLSIGFIKRKTDKKLPQYIDADDTDVYLYAEAEDLVPEFQKNNLGNFQLNSNGDYLIRERTSDDNNYLIRYYKPRIEGSFASIERWINKATGRIKWRVITSNNVTSLFGWTDNSIISNPQNPSQIFEWLPEFTFDDKGNCSQYIYKKDDAHGFDESLLHNKNRIKSGAITYTNNYVEKILYGNKTPYKKFGDAFNNEADYMFQTVFDYGTLNETDSFEIINDWDFRTDAFSNYKAGFEIRTTRLCKRVLLFHVFEELAVENDLSDKKTLIKSINFEYNSHIENGFTFLEKISSYGYIKKTDGTYSHKNLPPLEFTYQKHDWNNEVKSISQENLVHAPIGVENQEYQFTDLYNEGLNGILSEQNSGWYYKRNLGNATFEQAQLVSPKPSIAGLGKQFHLADLDADGGKQLVSYETNPLGYFELNDHNKWENLQEFKSLPNINFGDPNTRMLDLNGDGKPEIVISNETVFTWYESEGRTGFSEAMMTPKPFNEEDGPHLLFSNNEQSIYLADMSGDGLTDIVRIKNSEICYWPNLGYGKFGTKISLDNAPTFDHNDSFNPSYIVIADIDGSGTSDIIYLGKNKFTCWKNLGGNSFDKIPFEINDFPEIHNSSKIAVIDLLGNGTSCIVWSSLLSKDTTSPSKYIDLTNSKKPHLMVGFKNNLGKEVTLEYTASTKFYLEDRLAGKPWVTKLHFPVHCISKTTIEDKITGSKYISAYKYHHGYYDHTEREFRGFGMVEQIDAETFEHWVKGNASNIVEEDLHQEPVIVKTWNHTGAFIEKENILNQFEKDYWYNELQRLEGVVISHHEKTLDDARIEVAPGIDPAILNELSADEWQEALRACKGMGLRTETFAYDAIKYGNTNEARQRALTPYTVATHNCTIELLQPKGKNKHAVFIVKENESISYNYERNPSDPRISHTINILLDEYAHILESVSIVYPRKITDITLPIETQNEQAKTCIIFTQNKYTNDIIANDTNRLRLLSEVKTYELKGVAKNTTYYETTDFNEILLDINSDTALYHELDKALLPNKAQKRLIEHSRSTYYKNDLTGTLALHQLESKAIPYEAFQLAYTPELLEDIFDTRVNNALMIEGKYTHSEGDANWWIRSGTTQFISGIETVTNAINRFYLPISFTDPYDAITKVKYYKDYFLFISETEDALGNKSKVENIDTTKTGFNLRTLSPQWMKDINGNYSVNISDELGLIKAFAILGKGTEADDLTGIDEITLDAEKNKTIDFFNSTNSLNLISNAKALLSKATIRYIYDLDTYLISNKPIIISSIKREKHYQQMQDSPIQIGFEYMSGLGEIVMNKIQAEPGIVKSVTINEDNTYSIINPAIDTSKLTPKELRWNSNGKEIKNNKGNIVKQYEPYFSISWHYENYKELIEIGVSSIYFYDALGRIVKIQSPDDSFSKIEFDSWQQKIYDANDTILDSNWYINRINRLIDTELTQDDKDPIKEKKAAEKAAKHANTPKAIHLDTLGRAILYVDHNKNSITAADEYFKTKINIDIEGNIINVIDAREIIENGFKGNIVMQYKYDMLGSKAYHVSSDSGQRWILNNILGKSIRNWDERKHEFQYYYDLLHRPTYSIIIGGDRFNDDGTENPLNNIFDRIFYGEDLLDDIRTESNRFNEVALQQLNILGQVIKHYDTAGLLETSSYDFKGKPLTSTRKLFKKYKEIVHWSDTNIITDLEIDREFTFINESDALGRITKQTTPDNSIIIPTFNEAGLLNGESILHNGESTPTTYIKDIEYNEKGHKEKIIFGNDVSTRFYYDKKTFRINRIVSKRLNNEVLQDLNYTTDAIGNIVYIEDKAIPISFFANSIIEPISEYTYDALYRLSEAKGRENNFILNFSTCDNWNDKPYINNIYSGNTMAIRNYTQVYQYDQVGNITEMKHIALSGNWTRKYEYESINNRLKNTTIGDSISSVNYNNYQHHSKHGFIEELPHLESIIWNFKEEIVNTTRQHCTDDNIPVITYYQYDSKGQRIRKITENATSTGDIASVKEERVYISGYELYKKYSGTDTGLERISISLMDEGHRFVKIESRNNIDDGTEKKLIRYQLYNHIGSSTIEIEGSSTANLISYEEYHPYGTTAYQAINKAIKSASKQYRYTGMERDEETGLEYHNARYYLPWLGRWLNTDPLGIKDGINLYQYCKSNPINNLDKNGKQTTNWYDYSGHEIPATTLANVRVFIFYNTDFAAQAGDQFRAAEARYGVGTVALSNSGTTAGFTNAWQNMSGTNIAEVMIMTHGKNQSINIGNNGTNAQFTSTGTGLTNRSRSSAPNFQDLPNPTGNISNATLRLYTCHSADTDPTPHGSGDHQQGALTGTAEPIAQTISRTFNFSRVIGTAGSVNYDGGPPSFFNNWSFSYTPYVPVPEDGIWVTYSHGSIYTPPPPPRRSQYVTCPGVAACHTPMEAYKSTPTFNTPVFSDPTYNLFNFDLFNYPTRTNSTSTNSCPTGSCHTPNTVPNSMDNNNVLSDEEFKLLYEYIKTLSNQKQ